MTKMPLTLKGTQQGILLTPRATSWAEVLTALEHTLCDAEAFFHGGRVILELGARGITEGKLVALRELLDRHEIELWAILSEDEATIHIARSYGIRTRLPGQQQQQQQQPEQPATDPDENALFIQRTLRSGQSIHFPGHVTLLGDVNPGAEIIAGGNVIVWGKVRGLVHAGAFGDEKSVICALDLAPSQLRIAGHISRTPEERRRKRRPEIARYRKDSIVAEPWLIK